MEKRSPSAAHVPLAAIDMGSNSFRLEIGQMEQGRYRRIDYIKETVRLGGGLDAQGRLGDEAAQRGLACLARFKERLGSFAAWQVRAVATQTLREASNRDEFLQRAKAALGFPIEVISGREEARLIYAGVAHLQPSQRPRLVIDIGGRSTELILGKGRTPSAAESFGVGSVGLSMRFFENGRLTAEAFRAAQVAAGAEFEEALGTFDSRLWEEALGSSGTAGAVSQVLAAEGVTDGTITPDGLAWCIERCIQAGHVDKLDFAGMREDRRAVIAGGLAILYTLCALLRIRGLQPAKGALRQGVIIELDSRLRVDGTGQGLDLRDQSVRELQARFRADPAQARRVEKAAAALFEQVAGPQTGVEAHRELRWAAALHEVGMIISHHDHHRHSAYVIAHVDAAGFSQSQQRYVSSLVLGQRGGLRKLGEDLSSPLFQRQLMCLRLAVIASHARADAPSRRWRLQCGAEEAQLSFEGGMVADDPRALYLLREEVNHWQRSGGLVLKLRE